MVKEWTGGFSHYGIAPSTKRAHTRQSRKKFKFYVFILSIVTQRLAFLPISFSRRLTLILAWPLVLPCSPEWFIQIHFLITINWYAKNDKITCRFHSGKGNVPTRSRPDGCVQQLGSGTRKTASSCMNSGWGERQIWLSSSNSFLAWGQVSREFRFKA